MKVIVIGATGKIGREVAEALSADHEVVRVGVTRGDVRCDYTDAEAVRSMFATVGAYDALVAVAGGDVTFGLFDDLVDADYRYGFERKFLSQIRLVSSGKATIQDGGSFTLTSGFLTHYPNPHSIATGPINAAVDTFVEHTARLLPRGIRINVVSPAPVVAAGMAARGRVTPAQCAEAYVQAIEGTMSGQVLRVWGGLPIPRPHDRVESGDGGRDQS